MLLLRAGVEGHGLEPLVATWVGHLVCLMVCKTDELLWYALCIMHVIIILGLEAHYKCTGQPPCKDLQTN